MTDREKQSDSVKVFINDGDLKTAVFAENSLFFPINKFVSMDEDGIVRVLVGGKCPSCGSNIVRNVQTTRYCDEVLTPIVCSKFSFVKSLKPVLTTDSDFVKVVEEMGGSCFFLHEEALRTKMNHYKEIMDFHPTIDSAFKFMEVKVEIVEANLEEIELEDKVTRMDLLKRYNFFWYLDDNTSLLTKDGRFVHGMQDIMEAAAGNNLPNGFMVCVCDDKLMALSCLNNNLLKNHKFIVIKFD